MNIPPTPIATQLSEFHKFCELPPRMQQIIMEHMPLCSGRLITNNLALTCKPLFKRFSDHYESFSIVVNEENVKELLEREALEPEVLEERNLKKLSQYRYVFISKEITKLEHLNQILSALKSVVSLQIGYISDCYGRWSHSFPKLQKWAIESIGDSDIFLIALQPKLRSIAIGNMATNSTLIMATDEGSISYPSLECMLLFGYANVRMWILANYPNLIEVITHTMASASLTRIIESGRQDEVDLAKKYDEGPREKLLLGPDLIKFPEPLLPENAVNAAPLNIPLDQPND